MKASKEDIQKLGRLKRRPEFLRVQQAGQKWVSKGLILQAAPNEGLGVRFGLTVTKRLSKLAVERNRIRRRLKAVACDILPAYAADNMDFVLIGRPDSATRVYEDIQKDLIWCLKKLGHQNPL